jgi:hypothetical protein
MEQEKNFTIFERVVKNIYELLSPGCKVVHNDKVMGQYTCGLRQLDVSIRTSVAGHEILIVVECKDEKRKVDITEVEAFASKLKDVKADKGVMIAKKGFSNKALKFAPRAGIELCRIHDAEQKNWQLDLKIPIILEKIQPDVRFSGIVNLKENTKFNNEEVFKVSGVNWGEKFDEEWHAGKIPFSENEFDYDPKIENPSLLTSTGSEIPIKDFKIHVSLKRQYYLGFFKDLPTSKAIKNETTDKINLLINVKDVSDAEQKFILVPDLSSVAIDIKNHVKILVKPIMTDFNEHVVFQNDKSKFQISRQVKRDFSNKQVDGK